ncbi:DUF2182 domain-containing protein [Burkholderia sp. Ac-20365]|uniref:DUF2182 domain-containing protein n=1 Tax=Burkholderia sp. Ac-20365 TaxID=2703897 RepID=UPI001F11B88B|nr:DUF2182 domain-containing protein [Burkholderia sp. Ac-20365]
MRTRTDRTWVRVLAFFGVMTLVFAACATLTVVWCFAMAKMDELPMPGGWSLSMAWTPMCGQKWPRVAASFVGTWIVMMVAMMLPSLAPVLWRYHEAMGRAGRLTVLAGAGYFFVWALQGMAVFALGFLLMSLALQVPELARVVPFGAGVIALLAGAMQFSAWKLRYLACSRLLNVSIDASHRASAAWTQGLRLGLHCMFCCVGLTAVLLINGVMDLRAMALVTLAITAERFARFPHRVARAIGAVMIVEGSWMLARAFLRI